MAIVHDFELDVRGEACPYPLIRTKQKVDKLQKGEYNGNAIAQAEHTLIIDEAGCEVITR